LKSNCWLIDCVVGRHQPSGVHVVEPQLFAAHAPPHVVDPVHVSAQASVRVAPHRSTAVIDPQAAMFALHSSSVVSGSQPHTFDEPHAVSIAHVPQVAVRCAPQLSSAVSSPQLAPSREQNVASDSAWHPGGVGASIGVPVAASAPPSGGIAELEESG
jgi:hypothetical protein